MKCPMKFADGSRKATKTECEREDCAWWTMRRSEYGDEIFGCGVVFSALPIPVHDSTQVIFQE